MVIIEELTISDRKSMGGKVTSQISGPVRASDDYKLLRTTNMNRHLPKTPPN